MSVPARRTLTLGPRRLSVARWRRRRARRRAPLLIVGVGIVAVLLLLGFLASTITGHSPTTQNLTNVLKSPSAAHLFGTDQLGRDVFTRTLRAASIDLPIAFGLVGLAMAVGTGMGILAGWSGRWLDGLVARVIDVALAFPFLVLVIAIVTFRGPGVSSLFIAVAFTGWIYYARLTRGEVVAVKRMDYLRAAQISGFSRRRILIRHLLPNVVVQPLVYASSDLVYALLLSASVSYLGLGVQPPTPEWGQMVFEGQNFITQQWWLALFPGLAVVISALAFSLIGDGIADLARGDG